MNQRATAAARDKQCVIERKFEEWVFGEPQRVIERKFEEWVFGEPQRRERLGWKYNQIYNNTRIRKYDGSYLTFPGMTPEIILDPHQKDAVARILQSGNTLLAHCVGAGKTYTMITAANLQVYVTNQLHRISLLLSRLPTAIWKTGRKSIRSCFTRHM